MFQQNVIMVQEYERQSRARLQQEAEKSRLLPRSENKQTPKRFFPVWEFTLSKFRLIRMRLNPAN